jgi:hypothetical protein
MMKFLPWPEIEGFHNIRKFTAGNAHPEILNGQSVVEYKAKVKLHGTNAAVRIDMNGNVTAQSRTNIITPENDNAGFARWVKANEAEWKKCAAVPTKDNPADHYLNMVFFGEWIGPGIQKGVAVSEIPKKSFAVFAMKILGKDEEDVLFEVEPDRIALYLGKSGTKFACAEEANLQDVYILPWYEHSVSVDWSASSEELTKTIAPINDWVMAIEANDPWVEATFGVKGTGEGLVFYPRSAEHKSYNDFNNLVFKAKGEKHKNIATAKPAQVDASVAASIEEFAAMVLTEARLEQGATKVSADGSLTYDMKNTGKFVAWVSGDVEKETQDELAASNLTFKQVQKALGDKARAWYLAKAKAL